MINELLVIASVFTMHLEDSPVHIRDNVNQSYIYYQKKISKIPKNIKLTTKEHKRWVHSLILSSDLQPFANEDTQSRHDIAEFLLEYYIGIFNAVPEPNPKIVRELSIKRSTHGTPYDNYDLYYLNPNLIKYRLRDELADVILVANLLTKHPSLDSEKFLWSKLGNTLIDDMYTTDIILLHNKELITFPDYVIGNKIEFITGTNKYFGEMILEGFVEQHLFKKGISSFSKSEKDTLKLLFIPNGDLYLDDEK